MAKEGVLPRLVDMFGPGGQRLLDEMELADAYVVRVESLRDLIEVYDREITRLERKIHERLRDDRGYQAIQALDGIGRTMAAIFVTEIGDITRFRSPEASVLVGRVDTTPSRVGHEGDTRSDHQAGSQDRALGGARSRRPLPRRQPAPSTTSTGSPSGAARTKPASRWPANSSRSSTTDCATARSAVCATASRREGSDTTPSELADRHDSHPGGEVD